MKRETPLALRVFGRLGLGLVLLCGLCLALGMQTRPAHAQGLVVTDCTGENGTGQIGTVLSSASSGDTITFSCSGDIPLTSTLTINTSNLTIDGSGQSITLDGQNNVQVLVVGSGITFTLNNLTIAHGSSSCCNGGGLFNDGTVTISDSTFANNSAADGGGLGNNGTMTINNSTFVSNTGGEGGGLITTGTLTVSNSTFTSNSATDGGGINSQGGTATITNSTFSGNSVPSVGGRGGGIGNVGSGTVNVEGSIVANNSGNNCFGVSDQGYNLESGTDCGFTGTGDLQNANPLLSSLANNGGPTQTMALQQGSPAIDQVPLANCSSTDQRGDPRPDAATPAETTCDMGAYESSYTASLTVNGTNVSATEGAAFNGTVATGSYSGSGTLSASINWGDGTTASTGTVSLNAGSFSVTGSHTYAEEGSYTIVVSVNDGQGLSGSANSAATVSDAALTLKQFSARETSHLTEKVTALFTDADPAGTVSDYTATINWGDSKSSSATITKGSSGFTATGSHLYAKSGTYSVKLTVTDKGGSKLTKTVSVTIK